MKLIIIPPMTLVLEEMKQRKYVLKLENVQKVMQAKAPAGNLQLQIKYLNDILEAITDLRDHLQRFMGKKLI